MIRSLGLRCLVEVAATAVLVGVGTGAIVAARGDSPQWTLAVAWFVAVALPVVVFARWSGAHMNPAVTFALALSRRFPPREVLPYASAQVGGAFGGSFGVWAVLGDGIHLGATVPRGGDLLVILPLEVPFTAVLVLTVLYLTSPGRVVTPPKLLLPAVAVGVATFLIGPETGCSLNPARTLAPGALAGVYTGMPLYFVAAFLGAGLAVALSHAAARVFSKR